MIGRQGGAHAPRLSGPVLSPCFIHAPLSPGPAGGTADYSPAGSHTERRRDTREPCSHAGAAPMEQRKGSVLVTALALTVGTKHVQGSLEHPTG